MNLYSSWCQQGCDDDTIFFKFRQIWFFQNKIQKYFWAGISRLNTTNVLTNFHQTLSSFHYLVLTNSFRPWCKFGHVQAMQRTLAVGGRSLYSLSPFLQVCIKLLWYIQKTTYFLFGQIQSCQTGDQLYKYPSPNGKLEFSVLCIWSITASHYKAKKLYLFSNAPICIFAADCD